MLAEKAVLEHVFQKAVRFLTFRPRSEKEISDFLTQKFKRKSFRFTLSEKEKKNLVAQVIAKLKKIGLVNDVQFVDWWLEQRLSFNPKSERVLRLELLQKGVDRELIEEKLAMVDRAQLKEAIRQLIAKKMRLYRGLSEKLLRNKLLRYLTSRGFDYELVKGLVDEFL